MSRPTVLWVGLAALALIIIIQLGVLFGQPGRHAGAALLGIVASAALLAGLYWRQRWAYVLTLLFGVGTPAIMLLRAPSQALGVFIINAFVVGPVLLSTDYFWRPRSVD
jgi:hypothetical protein